MADIPTTQVFIFDDGPKEIKNCSWDELRQVIDYLATENARQADHLARALRMKTIIVHPDPTPWIWLSAILFIVLCWVIVACFVT